LLIPNQKRFGFSLRFRFLFCGTGSCGLRASLLGGFVVGASTCVALLAAWNQIVWVVGAASIYFNDVVGFGGFAFLAPVAYRVVA
jgi:hypothetical protein